MSYAQAISLSYRQRSSTWPRLLWLLSVIITLGLSVVVWKRKAEESFLPDYPVQHAIENVVIPAKASAELVVIKIEAIVYLPVWATARREGGLIEQDYSESLFEKRLLSQV